MACKKIPLLSLVQIGQFHSGIEGDFLFIYKVEQFRDKIGQTDETLNLIATFTKFFGHDLVGTFLCPNLGHIFF